MKKTLDRQPASSIARMLMLRYGTEGAPRRLAELRAQRDIKEFVIDCEGANHFVFLFTDADFDLIGEYVERHTARACKFFGVQQSLLGVLVAQA